MIEESNIDFNDIFLLECYKNNNLDLLEMFNLPNIKYLNLSSRLQWLKRQEFLVEDPNDTSKIIISLKGIDLLNILYSTNKNLISTKTIILDFNKSQDECFEEWWKTYPTTTSWESDDKKTKFTGSRALKNLKKSDAKKRYLKLLNQGLSHEDLIGGLKFEIKLKKLDSMKKNENKMEFFKGMESYFNQERYLLYIDSFKDSPNFIQETRISTSKNVTDI